MNLSWQAPVKPFVLTEEDLARTAMDYAMFRRGVDARAMRAKLGRLATYSASVTETDDSVVLEVSK